MTRPKSHEYFSETFSGRPSEMPGKTRSLLFYYQIFEKQLQIICIKLIFRTLRDIKWDVKFCSFHLVHLVT